MKDQANQSSSDRSFLMAPAVIICLLASQSFLALGFFERGLAVCLAAALTVCFALWIWETRSSQARARAKRLDQIKNLPRELFEPSANSVYLGRDSDLEIDIHIPDKFRNRHVHILGATGVAKTESVIMNLLKQDVARGFGSIILDAKGDYSFIKHLQRMVPADRLVIFDLSAESSTPYDPLAAGTPLEAAQRLFSSLTWSEEYYKSKALSALQALFEAHNKRTGSNPSLIRLNEYLSSAELYAAMALPAEASASTILKEFQDLSGLRDQVRTLTMGNLAKILSPQNTAGSVDLSKAEGGVIIYFRLQSLISSQIVAVLGKLIINHLNFLAGTAHRTEDEAKQRKLIPVYFDEFASFACTEFADLISKARSAGFALHFSHQSNGDIEHVAPGFLSRITDNSAVKIIMRVNDPDTAEFFARSFGTSLYKKATQRVTNAKDIDLAEVLEEGTIREAHKFRASPDLFKTLPNGTGAVLIAHGLDVNGGGSSVVKIRFPYICH